MALTDFLEGLDTEAPAPYQADISAFFRDAAGQPLPEGSKVLLWREPSVARLYQIGLDAQELKRRHPLWPDALCIDVATFGQCHVAPDPGEMGAGEFYARVAQAQNPRLWEYLKLLRDEAFPHLSGIMDRELLKNVLRGSLFSASNTSEDATPLSLDSPPS